MATTTAATADLWTLLDEDNVPWKECMKILRGLEKTKDPILHSLLDRNPPPAYLGQMLELRSQDLTKSEATIILGSHAYCYPIGIAIMLSSDLVFEKIIEATKNHAPRGGQDFLENVPIQEVPPGRLKLFMEAFPESVTTNKVLFDKLLSIRPDDATWPVIRCIIQHHPRQSDFSDSVPDLAVQLLRLFPWIANATNSSKLLAKIPKLLRNIITEFPIVDTSILHVAIDQIVQLPLLQKQSASKKLLKASTVSEILQIIATTCSASAANRDPYGRLPLHKASQHRLDGTLHILKVYPEAVRMRCPIANLYPYQLVGMDNRGGSVDLSWTILQAAPELLLTSTNKANDEWFSSSEHLSLVRYEMQMARSSRKLDEKIRAMRSAHDKTLRHMSEKREQLLVEVSRKKRRVV